MQPWVGLFVYYAVPPGQEAHWCQVVAELQGTVLAELNAEPRALPNADPVAGGQHSKGSTHDLQPVCRVWRRTDGATPTLMETYEAPQAHAAWLQRLCNGVAAAMAEQLPQARRHTEPFELFLPPSAHRGPGS